MAQPVSWSPCSKVMCYPLPLHWSVNAPTIVIFKFLTLPATTGREIILKLLQTSRVARTQSRHHWCTDQPWFIMTGFCRQPSEEKFLNCAQTWKMNSFFQSTFFPVIQTWPVRPLVMLSQTQQLRTKNILIALMKLEILKKINQSQISSHYSSKQIWK